MTILREEIIGNCRLLLGDCLEILPTLGPVDAVVTDPPFEAEAHTQQRRALGRGHEDGRRDIINAALPFAALSQEQREAVAKHGAEVCSGWFIAFCQAEAVLAWRLALEEAGARWRRSMIWVKPDGMPQFTGDRPGMGYESMAAAWCGTSRSRWNGGGRHGVFVVPKHDAGKGHGGEANPHPTTKPLRLMQDLVALFSDPGATILDPFLGSGTTLVACARMGRRGVGIEIEPRYFDIACKRIEDAYRQPNLFQEPKPKAVQPSMFDGDAA